MVCMLEHHWLLLYRLLTHDQLWTDLGLHRTGHALCCGALLMRGVHVVTL